MHALVSAWNQSINMFIRVIRSHSFIEEDTNCLLKNALKLSEQLSACYFHGHVLVSIEVYQGIFLSACEHPSDVKEASDSQKVS